MVEKIAFENEKKSYFQGLMTLILDRLILHTVVHHSSTSTYIPNVIEIEETFCGRTDVRRYRQTDRQTFETHFIRSTQKSRLKNHPVTVSHCSHAIWGEQQPLSHDSRGRGTRSGGCLRSELMGRQIDS